MPPEDYEVRVVLRAEEQTAEAVQRATQRVQDMAKRMEGALSAIAWGAIAQQIVRVGEEAVKAFASQQRAFTGLQAVAQAYGQSVSAAMDAAKRLTADGLLPLQSAVAALRDLLTAGLNIEQAAQLLQVFKDRAALGRAETVEFHQAVENLAQAFKTESSELGNLSGMTENFSQILEIGARQLGKTVNELTNAERAQAKFLGILSLSAPYLGGAAKMADTLSGAQSRLATTAQEARAAIGEALAPAVQQFVGAATEAVARLRDWTAANQEAARSMTLAAGGAIGMLAAFGGLTGLCRLLVSIFGGGLFGVAATVIIGLTGAVIGLGDAASSTAEKQRQQARQIQELVQRYQDLHAILKDGNLTHEQRQKVLQKIQDTVSELRKLVPGLTTELDRETKAVLLSADAWNKLAEAQDKAQRGILEEAVRWMKKFGASPEQIAEVEAQIDRGNVISQGELRRQEVEAEERQRRLRQEVTAPPPGVAEAAPAPTKEMSKALREALEDIQDLQALPRTPENLQRLLDAVLDVLNRFDGELANFVDQRRGLQRLARQVEQFELPRARFERAMAELQHAATMGDWERTAPERLKAGLERIQQEFADFLNRPENFDLKAALEERIKKAGDAMGEQARQAAEKAFREAQQVIENRRRVEGAAFGPEQELALMQSLGLKQLAAKLAVQTGDLAPFFEVLGRERELREQAQQQRFDREMARVEQERKRRMADLADEAARLQREVITAEQEVARLRAQGADTGEAEQRLFSLRQQLAGLFRPVLEDERRALEQLLQDTTLTAAQRQQVEERLAQVKDQLRQADVESHRLTEEAKTAATQRAAQQREAAERRATETIRALRDVLRRAQQQDLDALRQQQEAAERAQQARIDGLRRELQLLEQSRRETERLQKLEELRAALKRAEEAGPLEEFITAEGQRIFRNPEAERLREELRKAEEEAEFERRREELQRRIEHEEQVLAAMREAHRRAYDERQAAWQALLDLDDAELAALVSKTDTAMGDWHGALAKWLAEAQQTAEAKVKGIVSELARVVDEARRAQQALNDLKAGDGQAGGGQGAQGQTSGQQGSGGATAQPSAPASGGGGGGRTKLMDHGGLVEGPGVVGVGPIREWMVPDTLAPLTALADRLATLMLPRVPVAAAAGPSTLAVGPVQVQVTVNGAADAAAVRGAVAGGVEDALVRVARAAQLELRTR